MHNGVESISVAKTEFGDLTHLEKNGSIISEFKAVEGCRGRNCLEITSSCHNSSLQAAIEVKLQSLYIGCRFQIHHRIFMGHCWSVLNVLFM